MHEWALAEAVISAAMALSEKEKLKEVSEIIVKIGELQQIEIDLFTFALSQLKPNKLKATTFTIESENAKLKCRVCGTQWVFNKEKVGKNKSEAIHFVPELVHTYIKCPNCESPDFEILTGRGILLYQIKGVR